MVDLADGMVRTMKGLAGFLHIEIKDSDGSTVFHRATWCPNGPVQRVDPDAVGRSTYPVACGRNAFALGAVFGIDAGFGAPATPPFSMMANLPIGRYTGTVTIGEAWRDLLGISPDNARATVALRVRRLPGVSSASHCAAATPDGRCVSTAPAVPIGASPQGAVAAVPASHEPTRAGSKGDPDPSTLPDLRSLPAYGIRLKDARLIFAATVWDA